MNQLVEKQGDGVKINLALALALAGWMASIVGLGFWFGQQLQGINGRLDSVEASQASLRAAFDLQTADRAQYRRDTDTRLRVIENTQTGDRRDLANALQLLTRIDARLERIEQQYRSEP